MQAAGDAKADSKSEQAYAFIKARIVEGTYSPGYRLVLAKIAGDVGFSVVPVREAIRRLEAEGLVKFERNVGATVSGIDPTEYLYTMQTLSVVEGAATALSAPLIDATAIARARAVNEEMRQCLEHFDPVRFTALNRDFHSVLFEHCPNPHILDLVHRGWNRLATLRSSTFRFVPGRARESVREHEELLQLIERNADAETIERAARRHRSATLDAYLAQAPGTPKKISNSQEEKQ
ncbi:GntR family transcriptional regulator [Arthrobacter sp. H5]|uniref:GntR family transcriptional regulator n=1 Tax=Arthrobacter sp. H5 TaxID=1267973 RepID=UPI0004863F24|nr:GntR family transcriptional regulator [Arthrobacter sp. H5]